jgi:agmatinase
MGIRGPRNNPKQMKSALDVGASIITGYEIKKKGIDCAIQKALEIAKDGTDAVFVTVCSDILDVAFNPGGPPDMNGLTTFELSEILFRLAAAGINGFDFVEVYPSTDLNQVSSHTAAWMAIYVMSGIAKHRFNLEIPQF